MEGSWRGAPGAHRLLVQVLINTGYGVPWEILSGELIGVPIPRLASQLIILSDSACFSCIRVFSVSRSIHIGCIAQRDLLP